MIHQQDNQKIIVNYDTFCGWRLGAASVFDAITDAAPTAEVLHRHLFQGESSPRMRDGKGSQILQTIPEVEALTAQEFSEALKENIAKSQTEVVTSGLSAQTSRKNALWPRSIVHKSTRDCRSVRG